QRVLDAQSAVRSSLAQHFGQWLSDKMTRRLVQQRAQLLNAHQSAASEIAELDARLEKVQAPLHDRLRVYEQRITELEKELTLKSEENRELIKLKIELVRKRMEADQDGPRLIVNPGQANAQEIRLPPGTHTIGCDSIADFKIDHPSISGRHCEIIISDAGVMIKDLDSTNGTRINGDTVQAAVLQSGQRIHLGTVELFYAAEASPEALAAAEAGQRTARN
ncbi:MAG TPA: FHA domain-containing protein, partial [Verrucomicrobiae bacterium]|nr:FHA domain-containing protein [Verrucomicrobiae bacterium]